MVVYVEAAVAEVVGAPTMPPPHLMCPPPSGRAVFGVFEEGVWSSVEIMVPLLEALEA